jgi:hypothetical protein
MITEDYVSFETAKLLKEKGFSENTEHEIWYVIKQFSTGCHWNSCTYKVGDTTREYDDDCCIPMPTLQMAMKWLREVHNLYIEVSLSCDREDKNAKIFDASIFNVQNQRHKKLGNIQGYEQTCEAAIKYCLENLI